VAGGAVGSGSRGHDERRRSRRRKPQEWQEAQVRTTPLSVTWVTAGRDGRGVAARSGAATTLLRVPSDTATPTRRPPVPLLVGAGVGALEGGAFLVYAVLELLNTGAARLVMGATTAVFFAAYGALLVVCAWRVTRLDLWARSPLVLAQMLHLGLAWSFRSSPTTAVALVLLGVSTVVLVGLLHPASTAALTETGEQGGEGSP
jgi:hypothetical protein